MAHKEEEEEDLGKAHHYLDYAALENGHKQEKEPFLADMEVPLLSAKERSNDYSWSAIILAFVFPAMSGLLFGYDVGATSGAIVSLRSPELSGVSWYHFSSIQNGLVLSGSLFGALPGSILAFNIADPLGRRKELIVAACAFILGALASAFAPTLPILIGGKLVYGVGIGLGMHASPLYISETAPSKIRGTLVATKETFIMIGILIGYFVGSMTIDLVGGWRVMYGTAVPFALIMGVGMWWLPPSPRWVLLQAIRGKTSLEDAKKDAKAMFPSLRGASMSEQTVEDELNETLDAAAGGADEMSFAEIFQGKLNQRAFLIGGGLVLFQQITGQPSVLYYATQIFQSAGFPAASDATAVSVLLGVWKLVLTVVATLYIDKLGRRPLLITGVTGILLSLLALAAYYSFASDLSFLAIGALLFYVGSYQISFGPVSWLMVSEVFPLRSRGRAVSLTTLINFTSNGLVTFAFSPIQDAMGESFTFLIFAAVAVFALIFAITVVPETKGLTLEEIEAKLSK